MTLIEQLKQKATIEMPMGYDGVKYVFSPELFAKLVVEECANNLRRKFGQHGFINDMENNVGKELSKL